MGEKKTTEEFQVSGDNLLSKVKELIHTGNVSKIIIKDKDSKEMISVPVTAGVVLAVRAPVYLRL
jgi:ribosomal 30S subunit maturation factor RimM